MLYAQANPLRRAIRTFAASSPGSRLFAPLSDRLDRRVYRLTRGRHTFASVISGLPVILLTTTGARSGHPRTAPVVGLPTAYGLAVIASNWGKPRHPAWYHNLLANPTGYASINGTTRTFRASLAPADVRAQIWREALRVYPGWSQYERRASNRNIAVFLLELG